MQKAEFDQENCSDVHIWKENDNADNNSIDDIDVSLIDELMGPGPDLVSNAENVPSTSETDKTAWHEQWKPPPVKRQKLEERREKNKRSAKESRERAKQNQLMVIEKNKWLTLKNNKLLDEIDKLKGKVHNLAIVKHSIIHQDSCEERFGTVDINATVSGCSMAQQIVEKIKDNGRIEIIFSDEITTNDGSVTDYGYCQQQRQLQTVEQEVGTQPGLSSTQRNLFAPSGCHAFSSSRTGFQPFSSTSQAETPANHDAVEMHFKNLNTAYDKLSMIPVRNVSDQSSLLLIGNVSDPSPVLSANNVLHQSSLISVRNVSDQFCPLPVRNIPDQFSLLPVTNGSDQSSLLPVRNGSDQSSLLPVRNGSDQSSLLPVRNIPEQFSLLPVRNGSDQSSLIPVRNVSDPSTLLSVHQSSLIPLNSVLHQSSLISESSVSDHSSFIPERNVSEKMTVETINQHSTAVVTSQSHISYLHQRPQSKHHSSFEYPWGIGRDQNDNKERQELIESFLE